MKLDFDLLVLKGKMSFVLWFLSNQYERYQGIVPEPSRLQWAVNIILYGEYVLRYVPPDWTLDKWHDTSSFKSTEIFRSRNVYDLIDEFRNMIMNPSLTQHQQDAVEKCFTAVFKAFNEWNQWLEQSGDQDQAHYQMTMLDKLVTVHAQEVWSEFSQGKPYI